MEVDMFFRDIDKRIKILFLVLSLLLVVVIIRVFYIQVFDYTKLSDLANDLWSRDLEIEADRGLILDREGNVLADNLTTASLMLIPNQIKDKERVSLELSKILGVSLEEMKKHVYKKTSIERVHPEGRRLSNEVAEAISAFNFEGVYLVKEAKRHYLYNDFLSHSLGYVGIDNQGLAGIELQYDKYLTGSNGKIKYYSDAHGNRLKKSDIYIAPEAGMNINLTVSLPIQLSLERELDNIVSMFSPDMALMIVVDPKSGEILGMASTPDFNPNKYKNYSSSVLSRNLPIWASFEPGSTFKIVTPFFSHCCLKDELGDTYE